MEIHLEDVPACSTDLPSGYRWKEWNSADIERHALTKFRSFRDELDSEVFSCLGEYFGCLRLMNEISRQEAFLAPATWLLSYTDEAGSPQDCGTIQGIAVSDQLGSIQNIGIVPEHRNLGLGRALLAKSLEGFRLARIKRVVLEVTANNSVAVGLYRSLGFRVLRTMYRASPIEETVS